MFYAAPELVSNTIAILTELTIAVGIILLVDFVTRGDQ